jgi:hypothetical protein
VRLREDDLPGAFLEKMRPHVEDSGLSSTKPRRRDSAPFSSARGFSSGSSSSVPVLPWPGALDSPPSRPKPAPPGSDSLRTKRPGRSASSTERRNLAEPGWALLRVHERGSRSPESRTGFQQGQGAEVVTSDPRCGKGNGPGPRKARVEP